MHILVVDDDNSHRAVLSTLLADWGYSITAVADGESAIEACRANPFDLALMDVRMTGISGIEALKEIKSYNPAIPVIITTAYSDVGNAVEALKSGAYDYLTKPLDFDELKLTLGRAAEHLKLVDENKALKSMLAFSFDPGDVIGQSPPMRSLLDMVSAVASSDATILITGESGTGKEVIAKMIHANSKRRSGPYIAVNCSALTETLLESELFGHERGAFTGAEKKRDGRFLAADKGTIFLDEIGEIPMPMQAKLLRAVQEREIQKVGNDQAVKVDVPFWPPPTRICRRRSPPGVFGRISFTGSMLSLFVCPHCGIGRKIYRFWPCIFSRLAREKTKNPSRDSRREQWAG
jgi:two-component system response regulator HydG